MKVLVLGDANTDLVFKVLSDKTISQPKLYPGGTAANTAAGLATLGKKVKFVGAIGNDYNGDFIKENFKSLGISTETLFTLEGHPTANVIALVDADGERHISVYPPCDAAHSLLSVKKINKTLFNDVGWFHTTGLSLVENKTRIATLKAIDIANSMDIPVSFDLNLRLEHYDKKPQYLAAIKKAVKKSDFILGSIEDEYLPLTSTALIDTAIERLSDGLQVFICRNGKKDCIVYEGEKKFFVPTFSTKVRDTIGAGDAFNAGFIFATLEGMTVKMATKIACATASINISKTGARNVPNEIELKQFLDKRT
ncbi:MAG: carbohydrate kinase [Desulfovibrionales bacterium]|nr:carbohydrate kinase [Desulfovibrionales bacterium]